MRSKRPLRCAALAPGWCNERCQEYSEIRDEYYATLVDKKWKSLAEVPSKEDREHRPDQSVERRKKRSRSLIGTSCRPSRVAGTATAATALLEGIHYKHHES